MATKEYNVVTRTRTARSRSERRGESATGGLVSSSVVRSSGSTSESSGGAGGHSHSNKELLDALQRDDERYLYLRDWNSAGGEDGTGEYESEKAKAGYADEAGKADNSKKWNEKEMSEMMDQPVRKSDDVEHKNITATETVKGTTLEGDILTVKENATVGGELHAKRVIADSEDDGTIVSSKNFDGTSALAGTGYGILKEGNSYKMAIDYLTVRKGMTVAELVIQEYKSVGGVLVVSACNGEIEKVAYNANGNCGIYFKDWEKRPQFVEGDFARCSYWDDATNSFVSYILWVDVIFTDDEGKEYVSFFYDGVVEPKVGDNLVQWGNAYDTSRQGLILIS